MLREWFEFQDGEGTPIKRELLKRETANNLSATGSFLQLACQTRVWKSIGFPCGRHPT